MGYFTNDKMEIIIWKYKAIACKLPSRLLAGGNYMNSKRLQPS
jgi:hypothetical protein